MKSFIVLLALLGLLAWAAPGNTTPAPASVPAISCTEDMPCWDCSSMGNMICGAVQTEPSEPWPYWAWLEAAPLPSFMDYLWYLDGDCWGC